MEVERALSAAPSLDGVVLTAKAGVAAAAAKVSYDFFSGLHDNTLRLLEVAGGLAAVYLVVKYGLRFAGE